MLTVPDNLASDKEKEMSTVLAVLFAAIIGIGFLLWGYRIFLVMLPIWGFFAGFWLGAGGISLFLGQGFLATVTGWVVGFALGVIGAVLSYLFYGAFVIHGGGRPGSRHPDRLGDYDRVDHCGRSPD